jgi:hypothetical protein
MSKVLDESVAAKQQIEAINVRCRAAAAGSGVGEARGLAVGRDGRPVSSLLFFHLLRTRHAVLLLPVTAPRDGSVRVAMANRG